MEHGWELLILQQHASGKVAPPAAASQQGGGLHPSWQQRQLRMHAWQHAYAQPARVASAKWGHSPESWGNGENIPLFPGLGECVGMGGMPILPLK